VNGHIAAAAHLVARGAELTLASAVCLGRLGDARRLADAASDADKQFALVLAALNGQVEAVKWMLDPGADANRPSAALYSHAPPPAAPAPPFPRPAPPSPPPLARAPGHQGAPPPKPAPPPPSPTPPGMARRSAGPSTTWRRGRTPTRRGGMGR